MTAAIWTGAMTASDISFLIAVVAAGIAAVVLLVREQWESGLVGAAVALVALGLLAL